MPTSLEALRALDLPAPRVTYLARLLLAARTADDRQRIINDATKEATRNAYRVKAEADGQFQLHRERERRAGIAPEKPQESARAPRRYAESYPAPRPVTTRWVAPTKQAESVPVCPPEHPHSDHCYTAHRCRCERCRAAKAKTQREHRERKFGRTQPIEGEEWRWTLPPDDPRHGTGNGYRNLGCRCDRCREAHRVETLTRRREARK